MEGRDRASLHRPTSAADRSTLATWIMTFIEKAPIALNPNSQRDTTSMKLRILFLAAATAFVSSTAFAQEPPPFQVRGVTAGGTGCPAGTVSALASSGDGTQALTI